MTLPIFNRGRSSLVATEDAVAVLTSVDARKKVCATVPQYVRDSVEFIVGMNSLNHWKDICTDLIVGFACTGTKT